MLTGVIDPAGGAAASPSASMIALSGPVYSKFVLPLPSLAPQMQRASCRYRRSFSPIRYAIEAPDPGRLCRVATAERAEREQDLN